MRILVLGAGGMMGHMACRVLAPRHEVYGTARQAYHSATPLARFLPADRWISGVDAFRFDTVLTALATVRPHAVINCIGVVKQLKEAKDPLVSIECNALLPHRLATACAAAGAKLVHLSTDCVFSGRRGMYTEDDIPDPVDLYGRTKLVGETDLGGALTIRSSIIGRQLSGTSGLVEWFISQRGRKVKGFARAVYTGLTTAAMVRLIERVLIEHPTLSGVWQVASSPITKLDLLTDLNERLGLGIEIERDDEFACDRSLSGARFERETGILVPSWDEMLAELAADAATYEALPASRG
ncbi:MAG: SDR family oxidoreductase [Candidatus Sumerlaeaceae bacterium]|nr:SDR family oxidoreductase [Candidatus Sumerlaeaceae bacterium]